MSAFIDMQFEKKNKTEKQKTEQKTEKAENRRK